MSIQVQTQKEVHEQTFHHSTHNDHQRPHLQNRRSVENIKDTACQTCEVCLCRQGVPLAERTTHAEHEMAARKKPCAAQKNKLLSYRVPWKRSQTNRAWDVACGPPQIGGNQNIRSTRPQYQHQRLWRLVKTRERSL